MRGGQVGRGPGSTGGTPRELGGLFDQAAAFGVGFQGAVGEIGERFFAVYRSLHLAALGAIGGGDPARRACLAGRPSPRRGRRAG